MEVVKTSGKIYFVKQADIARRQVLHVRLSESHTAPAFFVVFFVLPWGLSGMSGAL